MSLSCENEQNALDLFQVFVDSATDDVLKRLLYYIVIELHNREKEFHNVSHGQECP
jgi:hypothetical protein